MRETAPLIEDLVRIDSVNPALDPTGGGEAEIADFVAGWARAHGLEVRTLDAVAARPSVIVRAPGGGGGRTLMLNAHLDTVGVAGMRAPFEPDVRDGRMYGRGTMDMKGSLAACLLAVADATSRDLRGDVVLAAVADEEHGSIGSEAAVAEVPADGAIVTEPTDLDIHVAHRGFSVFEVELEGKASHTSKPEQGTNALTHLGRLLAAIERHDDALRAAAPHPLLAHGSLQAVLASGGRELFTTPARASATIERRTLPGESADAVRYEVEELLARLGQDDPTFSADVRTLVAREPFEAPDGSAIEASLTSALRAVRGAEPRRLGAPYWTDAALVQAAGIPTVLFGPVGGGIHEPGEWLDVASVDVVRRVLNAAIDDFCG